MTNLEERLAFLVVAIDAGKFATPELAVQAILDVMGSCTVEHRTQLSLWFSKLPDVKR